MSFSLALDILVAALLVVTIVYAVILNRRLGVFRSHKSELETLAASFTDATLRADESVGKLKVMADDLQVRLDKAQALHDDLVFLIDRGGSEADRLEETVRKARDENGPAYGVNLGRDPVAPNGVENITLAGGDGELEKTDGEDADSPSRSEATRALIKALQSAR